MVVRRSTAAYSKLLVDRFGSALALDKLPAELRSPRVPIGAAHEQLERAVAASGDPLLGLKVGRKLSYGDGGAIDYAMQTAPTVEAAFTTASRFIRVLNGELEIVLQRRGARAHVELHSHAPLPAPVEDFLISSLFTVHVQALLPERAEPECWFVQRRPRDPSLHQKHLPGAKLRFAAPHRGFVFAASWLERPLSSADAKLHMILTRYLERDLREVPDALTFSERVYKALEHETPLRDSVAKSMAAALNTTPRTLARRLHDEGTSFGQLLDDVRRTRATRYLDDDAMSVQEIAAALGFSSASAFHRAFKRWMGITPQDYRRAQRDR